MGKRRAITYAFFIFLGVLIAGCQSELLLEPTATQPPPTATAAPTAPPTPEPYSGTGFDAFLARVEGARLSDRPPLVNRYMAQLPAGPLTDGTRAIFLWRGEGQTVHVTGDMNGWTPAGEPALRPIEGTDLWVGEGQYETGARLDYRFVVDGGRGILDPLNARTVPGATTNGPNSVLTMPAYTAPPEVRAVLAGQMGDIPAGTLTQHTLDSAAMGDTRTIFIYTPASELVGEKLPSLYVLDGGAFINLVDAPALLDWLIAEGEIPPLVAVFIPPVTRELEYDRSDAYTGFLADELVPFVQATADTDPAGAKTGILGVSLGGVEAVYASLSRPETFGLAAGVSGFYGVGEDALMEQVRQTAARPGRFYLAAGTYETAVGDGAIDILSANRRLADVLDSGGFTLRYEEFPQGHSWGFWRDTFGAALRYLYE